MRILITGSDGKIGKELVRKLRETENELLLVDKKGFDSVMCDLSCDGLEFIRDFRPEIIFHLAASFERTDETPQFHWINQKDNILATYKLNELIASLDYCPTQYIYASSYLVYDSRLYLSKLPLREPRILSECDEIDPRNLIGASKLYGEKEIDFLRKNIHKDMKVTHARIFRVFGEGGQEFVSRLLEWKKLGIPVEVWKPENKFDYIHTSDCANALIDLIGHGGVFNVGTGKATSIGEIVGTINPQIRITERNDLFESSRADIENIQAVTNWKPTINVIDWINSKL